MRNWLEKYFGFNHRELNGITILAIVLLLLWFGPPAYRYWYPDERHNQAATIREIAQFLAAPAERQETPLPAGERFVFDPNDLPVSDWERLGLADRQIRMIKNYEAKGGHFRKKEDLAKIYAITDADYAQLAPYIRIKKTHSINDNDSGEVPLRPVTSSVPIPEKPEAMPPEEPVWIELNTTDSLALQALPGIGPVYASRIVRFRNLLGGFHDTQQLLNVYGMDTARYNQLKPLVFVDTAAMRKIPVNSADYYQLRKHPYISSTLARLIVQYRKQHGPYRQLTDLLEIAVMDEENFRKIAPYLNVTHD